MKTVKIIDLLNRLDKLKDDEQFIIDMGFEETNISKGRVEAYNKAIELVELLLCSDVVDEEKLKEEANISFPAISPLPGHEFQQERCRTAYIKGYKDAYNAYFGKWQTV